jgi:hypothetical protein
VVCSNGLKFNQFEKESTVSFLTIFHSRSIVHNHILQIKLYKLLKTQKNCITMGAILQPQIVCKIATKLHSRGAITTPIQK